MCFSVGLRLWTGMNTPEMNHSGSIVAWTSGCAVSASRSAPRRRSAMHANAIVATTVVTAIAAIDAGANPTP